jgi:hypothetical protein
MQRTLFALIACLIMFIGNAQPLTWVQGVVVLHDQSVISGRLCFQPGDVILVKENNRSRVYPAHQLLQVRYYDKKENINRIFYSMPELALNKFSMRLYELVINGPLRVWRIPLTDSYKLTYRNPNDYLYFIEWQGTRIPLRKFRTHIYPDLIWNDEVPDKLNPNRMADALKIVLRYNQQRYSASLAGI